MRSTWRNSEYESGWGHPRAAVKWLLILNASIFCLSLLLERFGILSLNQFFALFPPAISQGWIWQFVSYMFLHGGVFHLLFNLLALYFFGMEVEAAIGSKRFLQLYFLGGIVGGLAWYLFNIGNLALMVGASGAVYAVVIAFATLYPDRPITLLLFFVFPVNLLAKYLAIGVVAVSILFSIDGGGNIGHLAHLGGALVGFLYIKMMLGGWTLPPLKRPSLRKNPSRSSTHLHLLSRPNPPKEEFIQQRIDPILDKIAAHGIQSLTREERRQLDEAKDRLS